MRDRVDQVEWLDRAEQIDRTEPPADPAAHRLLRRAYEATYRFPEGFGGFEAALYYARDPACRSGTVEIRSPSDIRITGSIEDERLRRELSSIVSHRWPLSYEDADGRHRLSIEPEKHSLGTLVRVEDDGTDSTYHVHGGHIQQIERSVGGRRFSINIQERNYTDDGRALPAHFCAVYWQIDGDGMEKRLVRTDIYRDGYIPVGGVYLPLSRRVVTADDSGTSIWQILLRDHRLLEGGGNDPAIAGNTIETSP